MLKSFCRCATIRTPHRATKLSASHRCRQLPSRLGRARRDSDGKRDALEPTPPASRSRSPRSPSRAGVSPTTVSHVLSGKRIVGAATRGTVMDGDRGARLPAQPRRPQPAHPPLAHGRGRRPRHHQPVLQRADPRARRRASTQPATAPTSATPTACTSASAKFFQDVFDRGVDGIVLASGDTASRMQFGPAELGTPIVCIGGALDHPALRHRDGRRRDRLPRCRGAPHRPGLRADRDDPGPARVRRRRTRASGRAMHAAGRKVDPAAAGARRLDPQRRATRRCSSCWRCRSAPDAVFCANDLTAIGAVDVAHELGSGDARRHRGRGLRRRRRRHHRRPRS